MKALPRLALVEQPLTVRTLFDELQQMVMREDASGLEVMPTNVAAPRSIGVVRRPRKLADGQDRVYCYAQFIDASGVRQQTYLGDASDPGVAATVAWLESTQSAEALRHRRKMVRALRQAGYAAPDSLLSGAINVLARMGIFRAGATLVGTPAYGAILNRLGYEERPSPMIRDLDVSFQGIRVALPDPLKMEQAFKSWNPDPVRDKPRRSGRGRIARTA